MTSIEPGSNGASADPIVPHPVGSRLAQRLAVLERMIREEQSNPIRTRLLEPILERLRLLERMVERIGVDEARGLLVGLLVREAEASCIGCRNAGECRRWLDASDDDEAYRAFCANAALFDLLPHRLL
jgi:hypothetical protein